MESSNLNHNGIKFLEKDIEDMEQLCLEKGIVLDYIFIKNKEKYNDSYNAHKEIAILSMLKIKTRIYKNVLNNILENKNYLYTEDEIEKAKKGSFNYFKITIEKENILGEKIKCANFFGEEDCFMEQDHITNNWSSNWNRQGYKGAFFNPPHCLLKLQKEQEVFNNINNKYLSPFNDQNLEIYSWNNDWSNYFDDGKEWWGTFYWTIYNKEKDMYIVIAGSATD